MSSSVFTLFAASFFFCLAFNCYFCMWQARRRKWKRWKMQSKRPLLQNFCAISFFSRGFLQLSQRRNLWLGRHSCKFFYSSCFIFFSFAFYLFTSCNSLMLLLLRMIMLLIFVDLRDDSGLKSARKSTIPFLCTCVCLYFFYIPNETFIWPFFYCFVFSCFFSYHL